jgi:hypothetical protein
MARLAGSVGSGGRNRPPDVKYVQTLLSDWLLIRREEPLEVDGLCGPLTNRAIETFQSIETGIVDGRVDPDGPAIHKLESLHLANLASGIYGLARFGDMSGMVPAYPQLDVNEFARRYLVALRGAFG